MNSSLKPPLKSSLSSIARLLSTALPVAVLLGTFAPMFAQSAQAQQLPPLPIEFNPDDLVNPGRPGGRRRGGGSRGSCQTDLPLTAITYAQSNRVEELGVSRTDETVGALTTEANPLLWFYLPAPVQETGAELVIKDSNGQIVVQGLLEGTTESNGIVGVAVPTDLVVGQAYQWFLTVDCDETEQVTVNGWIERRTVGPDAERTLVQASGQNRAALYANYGFVQDALSELAQLRYFEPENDAIAQDWRQFLTALDLAALSEVPILPCCLLSAATSGDAPPGTVPDTVPDTAPDTAPDTEEDMPDAPEPVEEPAEDAPESDTRTILQRARDRGN